MPKYLSTRINKSKCNINEAIVSNLVQNNMIL